MGKVTGFIEIQRKKHPARDVAERLRDWNEVYLPYPDSALKDQAARCMDCGIPFCHQGCPLGNLIPDWNDLVYRDRWKAAIDRLHATNNFPEFTGRVCPAPCEEACVLGAVPGEKPVTIELVEKSVVERGVPPVAVDEIVPVGDQVAERAALMAERNAAIHAPRGLILEPGLGIGEIHLAPVAEAFGHGPRRRLLPLDFDEAGGFTHGPTLPRAARWPRWRACSRAA